MTHLVESPMLQTIWGISALLVLAIASGLYNCYFHPLASFPGPRLWSLSRLAYIWSLWKGHLHEDIKCIHDKYGPVVRIAPNELSFSNNDAWQSIYTGGNSNKGFPKHEVYRNVQTFESLFDAPDEQHTRLRRLVTKDFFSLRLARRQERLVQEYADLLVRQLRIHHCHPTGSTETALPPPAELRQWYNWVTFDTIGKIAISEDFGCLEGRSYHPWVLMIQNHLKLSAYAMALRYFPPLPTLAWCLAPRRLRAMRETFMELIRDEITNRRQRILPSGQQDFVSAALRQGLDHEYDNVTDGGSEVNRGANKDVHINVGELEANCILVLLAGSETMTASLLAATHLLCDNPETLRKLQAEVRTVAKTERDINYDNVTVNMPYLNAVMRETHRLCPPLANGPPRVVDREGALIAGHVVPRGTAVGVTQYAANRSAANFFEPDGFMPERWLTAEQSSRYGYTAEHHELFARDKHEVVRPFSHGGRDCLGQNLAWVEFRVFLGRMIWNFDFQAAPRRASGEHETLEMEHGKQSKRSRFSAFRYWSDQNAYLLWDKETFFVYLRERECL